MRKPIVVLVTAFLTIVVVSFLNAASQNPPGWLLFEQGNADFAKKEYGRALKLYKDAISAKGIFPEAEMAIGDVFIEEGEYDLAEAQYERAYNQRNAFIVPTQKYDALYKLARLRERKENFRGMEDCLKLVLEDDKRFSDPDNGRLKAQIEKNYFDKGLDQVIRLYVFDTPFATDAFSTLGWFYYRTGRFSQSVIHFLYAIIHRTNLVQVALAERDSEFEFNSITDLFDEMHKSASLTHLDESEAIFRDLYYLAGSTFALGYPKHSVQIWKLIVTFNRGGRYAELAARQIKKPWIEPLLGSKSKQ